MPAHLTEEYILAQRSQGARPESHSQGAAASQPALLISDCSGLRRPDALHPGAPRPLFLTKCCSRNRSQLRRSGWPFSRLAVSVLPTHACISVGGHCPAIGNTNWEQAMFCPLGSVQFQLWPCWGECQGPTRNSAAQETWLGCLWAS